MVYKIKSIRIFAIVVFLSEEDERLIGGFLEGGGFEGGVLLHEKLIEWEC